MVVNLSENQTLSVFLLYVRQTWKTQLIPTISYLRGYCPLIRKDSVTFMHGAVYVKEGLSFLRDLS